MKLKEKFIHMYSAWCVKKLVKRKGNIGMAISYLLNEKKGGNMNCYSSFISYKGIIYTFNKISKTLVWIIKAC